MARSILLLLVCFCFLAVATAEDKESVPGRDIPKKIVEAWLRFHEEDLCQGIDAVFVFRESGMEVRGLIDDENGYQRFEAMLRPLRSSYKIELQLDRRVEEKKQPDEKKEKDLPASLWENYELRSFLGDAIARARERIDFEDDTPSYLPPPDEMLKQRLMLYAEQVLEWNRRIERYGRHLPALTRIAHDPTLASGLHSRANAAVMAHARNMEKLTSRLKTNLEPAFPRGEKRDRAALPEKAVSAPKDIVAFADQISEYAQTVSQRVRQFIHPEQFTVGLDELRQPRLLESLKTLRIMNSDFQKAFAKTK